MTSAKTKSATKYPIQKTCENRKSSEFLSEIEGLRLGMERRKFSYTIHIPERRTGQIFIEAKQSIANSDKDNS
jgi:hypothetical protein